MMLGGPLLSLAFFGLVGLLAWLGVRDEEKNP